jgi:ubiquinone/menaquinone biosynthesis C-methylase UbiE
MLQVLCYFCEYRDHTMQQNVTETYNIIADWFFENRTRTLIEKPYLDKLIEITGPGGTVLDVGCGTGVPVMKYLIDEGNQTVGVDGSSRMLEIARKNLPGAEFYQCDMRELALHKTFDAIIAWHSFFHLPFADQPAMFPLFRKHLKNGGVLLFTSGKEQGEAWGMNGGENLFHASLDTARYRELLETNGFTVLQYVEDDPECGFATVWMAQVRHS